MSLEVRSRRREQFGQWAAERQQSVSELIAMLDVQTLLIDCPSTSVRQTIDVERLEDEIVSEPPAAPGSPAITLGTTDQIAAAIGDYDTVSEQVRTTATITTTTGCLKKSDVLLSISAPNVNGFSKFFTGTFCGQLATKFLFIIPPHLHCVATLPCEI